MFLENKCLLNIIVIVQYSISNVKCYKDKFPCITFLKQWKYIVYNDTVLCFESEILLSADCLSKNDFFQ